MLILLRTVRDATRQFAVERGMDNAVALVRAYLQLNGYFTITEYPVLRRLGDGTVRTLTEVDVAAFHLPGGEPDYTPDAALRVPRNKSDHDHR